MSTSETVERPVNAATSPRRPYATMVAGALLVVVGALWLLDATDVIELHASIVLPAVLAVIGLALIVGSFEGPHPGLVVAGVFITIATLAVAAAPPDALRGGIGERNVNVSGQADLESTYNVALGDLSLDLSDLTMSASAEVTATVGAGELVVTLPPDLAVDITASVGAGEIDLLGETGEGLSVNRTYTSDGFESAEVTLTLDLNVAAGSIEVDR